MALSATAITELKATIRYAVTHNSPYKGSLNVNPQSNTWDGLAQYLFTTLGMGNVRITNMWTWVNAHLPEGAKKVSSDDQKDCEKIGDVFDAFVKAAS